MRLYHNLASLDVYKTYSNVIGQQSGVIQRISSGLKINSSMDDPSAMSKGEKLEMRIRTLQMVNRNAQDGIGMLQTAEGGLNSITDSIQRLKELAINSADASLSDEGRAANQKEVNQILKGIDDSAKNTTFNGKSLLDDASKKTLDMPIGAGTGESATIPTFDFTVNGADMKDASGNYLGNIDVSTADGASKAISVIDSSLQSVISARSKYGALENTFEDTISNGNAFVEKLQEAQSSALDSDMGEEMIEYSKNSILQQASAAIMAQSNKLPMDILQILRNVK